MKNYAEAYGTVLPNGGYSVSVPQGMFGNCKHFIFDPTHYRADKSCRCDDPTEWPRLKAWGYKKGRDYAGQGA